MLLRLSQVNDNVSYKNTVERTRLDTLKRVCVLTIMSQVRLRLSEIKRDLKRLKMCFYFASDAELKMYTTKVRLDK